MAAEAPTPADDLPVLRNIFYLTDLHIEPYYDASHMENYLCRSLPPPPLLCVGVHCTCEVGEVWATGCGLDIHRRTQIGEVHRQP